MSQIALQITADDIAHGVRGDVEDCVVARAMNRTFPDGAAWTVGPREAMPVYVSGRKSARYRLCDDAVALVQFFDRGGIPYPQTVHLEAA